MSEQNYMLDQLNSKNKEAASWRHKYKEAKKQAQDLQKQVDQYKAQPEPSQEVDVLRQELAALKAEKTAQAHRKAFDKVAAGLGLVDETSREAAWKLAGYQPEGGEPQEDALKALLGKTLEAFPLLVPQQPLQAGPGYAKGASVGDPTKKVVRYQDMQDPDWQLANPWFLGAYDAGEVQMVD